MRVLPYLYLTQLAIAANIIDPGAKEGKAIPGSYIAVLKKPTLGGDASVSDVGVSIAQAASSAQPITVGTEVVSIGSFQALTLNGSQEAIQKLAGLQQIDYIQPNYIMTSQAFVTQKKSPNWGLGRISNRKSGNASYTYDSRAGNGTYAYIVDTGIATSHPEFQGRASFGYSTVPGQKTDGHGHGTHVAGIVGSKTYGVAKLTNLIAVKVLNDTGMGPMSGVIEGLQWAVRDAQNKKRTKKSVINMSLVGSRSPAMQDAAKAAVAAGIFVACAAGNYNDRVGYYSPANTEEVCTIAATDSSDNRAAYSNYGRRVDLFAPGTNIESTWPPNTSAVLSGTSMASPHVAGLAAYMLSIGPYRNATEQCSYLQSIATGKVVKSPMGSPRFLAYNGDP